MRKLCKVFAVLTLGTVVLAACGKAATEENSTGTPEVTATTAPSEESTPTVAPTATPEPTATPAPTPTPIVVIDPKPAYDFNDLVYQGSYGTVYEVQADGSIELQFEGQYQEIKLSLPEEIDMAHCHEVTVKAQSAFAPLSFKLYDASGSQIFVEYNCKSDTVTDFVLAPDITEKAAGIGLMALDNVDDFSQYKVTVYSVTFGMDEGYGVERVVEAETPLVPETENGATLLNTYGKTFGRIGTCINPAQLRDKKTLEKVKAQYNSVTLENDMKPDFILNNWSPTFISVEDAKALGYVIPENYKESTVPKLNFSTTDTVLKICAENGLGLRGHTLVWHAQTPKWFYKEGYQNDGNWVTPDVMDARLEFFIRTVMGHVYDSEYGHVLYSWDVVNEYVHATDSGWEAVYGNEGLTPSFVKLAYEVADDVLKQYGIRDQVSLIFNDFNTYIDYAKIKEVMKFINSEGKICDGVGMQAHLSTGNPTEIKFITTVKEFLKEGYEVQITELDIGNNGEGTQAMYVYDLMKRLLKLKKEGAAITGITYWGIGDNVSWRPGENALLFTTIDKPKKGYFEVLRAYTDSGFTVGE